MTMTVQDLRDQLRRVPGDLPVSLFTFNVPGVGDGIWSDHPLESVEWEVGVRLVAAD